MNIKKQQIIANAISEILDAVGENKHRTGLIDTPVRVAQSMFELTSGQGMTPADVIKDALFPTESSGMVLQRDLEFFSLCEHHLLPFSGKVHVAYLPDKKIIGLSKIPRIVDIFARRLQVQENLTHEIAHALNEILKPKGVAIIIEASHFCMMMRGVRKQSSVTITSEYLGEFLHNSDLRAEFLRSTQN